MHQGIPAELPNQPVTLSTLACGGHRCAGRTNRSRHDRYRFTPQVCAPVGECPAGAEREMRLSGYGIAPPGVWRSNRDSKPWSLSQYLGPSRGKVRPKKVNRSGLEPPHHLSGTGGSNPASSSGESDANLIFSIRGGRTWRAGTPRLSARFDPGRDSHRAHRGAGLEWNRRENGAGSVSSADPSQHPGDRRMATIETDFPAALR